MSKFHIGDLVALSDVGRKNRNHGDALDGIIVEHHGGDYAIFTRKKGFRAWYAASELTPVERGRHDLLREWRKEYEATVAMMSDIDWIFKHGPEVISHPYGCSLQTLYECIYPGCNIWGPRGEGMDYYRNAMIILDLATPYLALHDKAGWLKYCGRIL